jgi:hypothetical protein
MHSTASPLWARHPDQNRPLLAVLIAFHATISSTFLRSSPKNPADNNSFLLSSKSPFHWIKPLHSTQGALSKAFWSNENTSHDVQHTFQSPLPMWGEGERVPRARVRDDFSLAHSRARRPLQSYAIKNFQLDGGLSNIPLFAPGHRPNPQQPHYSRTALPDTQAIPETQFVCDPIPAALRDARHPIR